MKKLLLAMCLTLAGVFAVSAELHLDTKKDKVGYVDDNGTVVIKHQFTKAYPFADGMAKVAKGDKWGYIDESGKPVIKIEYATIEDFDKNGIARVKKGKKYGYIRRDGSFVVKPEYDFIGSINEEGYVWVAKGKSLDVAQKGLMKDGNVILKPKFSKLGFYQTTDSADYADGHVFVKEDAYEITENLSKLSTSKIPYVWTVVGWMHSIYDLNGAEIVKPGNHAMGAPSDGMALTRTYNKKKNTYTYNYLPVGNKGNKVLKKDVVVEAGGSQGCWPFHEGKALNFHDGSAYLIDKTGAKVSDGYDDVVVICDGSYIVKKNNMFGLMNRAGQETVACSYADIRKPVGSDVLFAAKDSSTGKYGVIDNAGHQVVPFSYSLIAGSQAGRTYIKENGKWGIIDNSCRKITAPKWESIMIAHHEGDTHTWVQDVADHKWKCLDIKRDALSYKFEFDSVWNFDKDGRSQVKSGEQYGVVDNAGRTVIPVRFSDRNTLPVALAFIQERGLDSMDDAEAWRFNAYFNPMRHKTYLHNTIAPEMWDF